MANELVNFNLPSPYQADLAKIAQQQKMAELLQAQSLQPTERYSYKGIEAHTPATAGLAKILQAMGGAYLQKQGLEESKALGEDFRNRSSMEGREFIGALKGTPEIPMPAEEQGGGPGRPAQGPDMARALEMSMNSVNPMVQSAGGAMLTQMLKPSETAFGKVDAKDYTPESVKAFLVGGGKDFSILVPRIKYERERTGSDVSIVNPYDPTGKAVSTIPITVSPDTSARLSQERAISDRNFNQLSANQQAQLKNEAARLNISAEQLFFDTNVRAGGAAMPPATGPSYLPVPAAAGAAPPGMPPAARPVGQPVPGAAPVQAAPRIGMAPARAAQPVTPAFAPNAVGPTGQAVQANQPNVVQTAAGPVQLSGKERQKLAVASLEAQQKKEQGMSGLGDAITEARNILTGTDPLTGTPGQKPLPTASGAGSLVDYLGNIVGQAPRGQNEAKRLEVVAAILTSKVPRMEGPQSDRDVELYKQAAGNAGNSGLPISTRLAALDTMQKLYGKYERFNAPAANQQTQSPQSNQRRYTVDY
jgi:hypothetical protein